MYVIIPMFADICLILQPKQVKTNKNGKVNLNNTGISDPVVKGRG